MDQKQLQLTLSEAELSRLDSHIWNCFIGAEMNHDRRIQRFQRYWRMWRGTQQMPDGADLDVPLLKWVTFSHWARIMAAVFGEDAEIIAAARAPEAEKIAAKVGLYETWRLFEYMKGVPALSAWLFNTVLYGRAHAFIPYEQEYFWEREEGGGDKERVCYDGPKIYPLRFDQVMVPAQDNAQSIDDYEWVLRRQRITPDQLLEGEKRGKYQGIRDRWSEITAYAENKQERDYWLDSAGLEVDRAEGVDHSTMMGNRDSLDMWVWYGRWRLPKGKADSRPQNLKRRQPEQSEIAVSYLKDMRMIVGVQDLRDLYPRMKKRIPILDIGLIKDGSYWGPGLGELCEQLQNKSSANYKLFEEAGKFSVGPVIFYKATSGFDPQTFVYKPNTSIPSEDPAGVNVVRMQADLTFSEKNQQALQGFAELVTGDSNSTSGVSEDRPNAPRTLGGQQLLAEQGNVRIELDMLMLRDDLSTVLEYLWALDREYAPESLFFRVTEDDANGLFDVNKGFGTMTAEERNHEFDFQLKFATSVWSKEAKKQYMLQLYQLSLANPIIQQNPRALWVLLNKLWKCFGEDNFRDILPEPPEMDQPNNPKTEWAMALKGEELHVNPLDDDQKHIIDHQRRVEHDQQEKSEDQDLMAQNEMAKHILEHEAQMKQKMLMQLAVQKLQQQMPQQPPGMPGAPGGAAPAPGPQPGAPPSPVAGGPLGASPAAPSPVSAIALGGPQGMGGPGVGA